MHLRFNPFGDIVAGLEEQFSTMEGSNPLVYFIIHVDNMLDDLVMPD